LNPGPGPRGCARGGRGAERGARGAVLLVMAGGGWPKSRAVQAEEGQRTAELRAAVARLGPEQARAAGAAQPAGGRAGGRGPVVHGSSWRASPRSKQMAQAVLPAIQPGAARGAEQRAGARAALAGKGAAAAGIAAGGAGRGAAGKGRAPATSAALEGMTVRNQGVSRVTPAMLHGPPPPPPPDKSPPAAPSPPPGTWDGQMRAPSGVPRPTSSSVSLEKESRLGLGSSGTGTGEAPAGTVNT